MPLQEGRNWKGTDVTRCTFVASLSYTFAICVLVYTSIASSDLATFSYITSHHCKHSLLEHPIIALIV